MSLDVQLDLGPHLDDTGRTPLEPYEDLYGADETADRQPRPGSGAEPNDASRSPSTASGASVRSAIEEHRPRLEDRLVAAGIDDASLRIAMVATDGAVELRMTLQGPAGRVDVNRQDVSIEAVVREGFRELDDRLQTELARLGGEPSTGGDWSALADSVHRYALHEVEKLRRDGLPLGDVDPRDLAESALAMAVESGARPDPAVALPQLYRRVDERLAGQLPAEPRAPRPLADAHPEPAPDRVAATAEERHELTEALFALSDGDRRVFAETVIDALPVPWAAHARDTTPEAIEERLDAIASDLEQRLEEPRATVLRRYRDLGHTLRNERLAAARTATFETPPT